MNKDINDTLCQLAKIMVMNGEPVKSIEAVEDWYDNGRYMKEVAEITYENGCRRYADIDCDSNLAAVYDVMAVVVGVKERAQMVENIKRGVYPLKEQEHE